MKAQQTTHVFSGVPTACVVEQGACVCCREVTRLSTVLTSRDGGHLK